MCYYRSGGVARLRYIFSLKCLRKSYQTLNFCRYYEKYNNAQTALEFTASEMKYSSTKISSYHYVKNVDIIQPFKHLNPMEILNSNQKTLNEYVKH